MEIAIFQKYNKQYKSEAAELLVESFPHSYAACASDEIEKCMADDRIAVMALEDGHLVGFTGAIPQYGNTGWELHPMAVKRSCRSRGIGLLLIRALEREAAARGCVTMYLGTDDEFGKTSLSDIDLYQDTYSKIENIKNIDRHPYEFYQKAGYKIVGVIPDANGVGKPDIWMAKRIETA